MNNDDYYEITTQLDAREILRYLNNLGIQNISGEVLKYFITAPTIAIPKIEVEVPKRASSCVRIENKPARMSKEPRATSSLNNNLIKVPKQPLKRKTDPVSLYHYYTSLWAKYKPNVPGENNWSELRWSIRQKMAGSFPCPSSRAVTITNKEEMKSKKL
ncbi:unnamed protein product [Parnassius apollo]|uniref:(apollo) hypothetical protein n=1 Tax=Parnassius apollo TaxID=110799 RepID=A0A8S3WQV8_PARAO|nr:unnamed protein product [Parnassius apollo]